MKNKRQWILALTGLIALLLGGGAWWLGSPATPKILSQANCKLPPGTSTTMVASCVTSATVAALPATSTTVTKPFQSGMTTVAGTEVKPSLPGVPTPAGTNTARKFMDMRVLERGKIIKQIMKENLDTQFRLMLDAGQVECDGMKQSAIGICITDAIHDQIQPPGFMEKMRKFVEDDSQPRFERGLILGILSSAATKEAGELLLFEAINLKDKELRDSAVAMVGSMGECAANEDLSPALNAVWQKSADVKLSRASAMSMAAIGAPSSVELLLQATLAPDGQDDARRNAAAMALTKVSKTNAIPPVAALLAAHAPGSQQSVLASKILAHIVPDAGAAQVLMEWLKNADAAAAPQAYEWVVQARGAALVKAAKAALDPSVPFRSEANREALRAGLAAYDRNRIIAPAGVPLE